MKLIYLFIFLFSFIHMTLQEQDEVCMQIYLSCERNCRIFKPFKSKEYFKCEKVCLKDKFKCQKI